MEIIPRIKQWQVQRLLAVLSKGQPPPYQEIRAFWVSDNEVHEGHIKKNNSVSKAGRLSKETLRYYADELFSYPHFAVKVEYHNQDLVVAFWPWHYDDENDLRLMIERILDEPLEDTAVDTEGVRIRRPCLYLAEDPQAGVRK